MRFRSFMRSIFGLAFLLLFLLNALARPALAQSDEASSPDVKHPKLKVSPKPPLSFGEETVGLTSPTQTVTLFNQSGSFAIPLTSIRVKAPFVKANTTNCGTGVPAGGSCDINIAFKPTVPGKVDLNRGLTIAGAFKNTPLFYALRGTGVSGPTPTATPSATSTSTPIPGPGHIAVNRKAINLAAAPNSTASASITITNTGVGTLTANLTSPKHEPPLSEVGGGSGITIAPGAIHNVIVVFSPTKKGSTSDLILITSNDPNHKKAIKVKVKAKSK